MRAHALVASVAVAMFTLGCGASHESGGFGDGGGDSASTSSGVLAGTGGATTFATSSAAGSDTTGSGSTCDGSDPEGCACATVNATQACFVGDASKAGVGACVMGTQTCVEQGSGELATNAWGPCDGSGAPTAEVCGDGVDNDCNGTTDDGCDDCVNGDTAYCNTPQGDGTKTCTNGAWGPCALNPPGMTGTPCTPGSTSPADPDDPNCVYNGNTLGSAVTTLYCDNTGVWQCFYNSDCTPQTCGSCLQTNCAQYKTTTDAACAPHLANIWSWISGCGPDRTAYFADEDAGCPGGEIQSLINCRELSCDVDSDGPCNYY